jgi:hypothetical protein
MGTSAFEILIVPVIWGTFVGLIAGAAFLSLMNAIEEPVNHLGRLARSARARSQSARDSRRRAHRSARRVGSIG